MGILVDFQELPSSGPFAEHYSNTLRQLPLTVFEEIAILVLKVASMFAWTAIFGKLLAALTQSDPDRIRYQNDLDNMNRFCERHKLPESLTLEVRRYFFQTLSINHAEARKHALSKLSPALAEKVTYTVNQSWLEKLPFSGYLKSCVVKTNGVRDSQSKTFLTKIVMRMEPAVFAPKEIPPMPRLYFITAGSVLYRGSRGPRETLGPGRCWGANDVLSVQSNRSAFRAVAASYVHVQWIGAQEMRSLRFEHPELFRHLRRWAMLRDVASYLVRFMHRLPAALSEDDLKPSDSDGSRPIVSLERLPKADNELRDELRAKLVVNGHERVVRFREKDRAAVNESLFGDLQIKSVEGSKVGGAVRLKDDRAFPNPRLISGPVTTKEIDWTPVVTTKEIDWTPAMLRDSSTSGLWKLKRAIDAALEERMMTIDRKLKRAIDAAREEHMMTSEQIISPLMA